MTDNWQLREIAHYNGGRDWFGYKYQVVQQPRIQRMDRYIKRDKTVEQEWLLDGVVVESLQAAIEGLATPPVITDEEHCAIVAFIECGQPTRWELIVEYELLSSLTAKGLIWMDGGKGVATDLARALVTPA